MNKNNIELINSAEDYINTKYPDYYNIIVNCLVNNNKLTWGEKCFVPLVGVTELIKKMNSGIEDLTQVELVGEAEVMSAFAGWRANDRKVVFIDESDSNRLMKRAYIEQNINIDKIFEVIGYGTYFNLKCVYPFNQIDYVGALTHINFNETVSKYELMIDFLIKERSFIGYRLRLEEGKSVSECLYNSLNLSEEEIVSLKNEEFLGLDTAPMEARVDYNINKIVFTLFLIMIYDEGANN